VNTKDPEDIEQIQYVLSRLLMVGNPDEVHWGEMLAMVRHIIWAKDEAQARVRKLENILLRHHIREDDPLPPVWD
jgi:hypothetical protein